jgi:hypothetical protein
MKEVTLKIPDKKLNFFLELVQQLGIEVATSTSDIPEVHKNIVRERIKNAKSKDYTSWEEVRIQLNANPK